MTSLPPGEAHFHFGAKVGQRSAGKSAVAAAAYRAGARLYDQRLGREYDYTRKRYIHDTFILTPADAPAWAADRGVLWNRAEAAERRRDASLWRELEVSLPRDLEPKAYRPLLEQALAPYVAAGLACDVCVHCPPAADGGEQPHAHVMLTTRALGPDGFGVKKNADLVAILDGAKGAPRGEALKAERARWADVTNAHLRAAASDRRVDARSYAERGLDRRAEPKMGEADAARHRHQRERHARDPTTPRPRPSARQRHVGALRALRRTENQLLSAECEMVKTAKVNYSGSKQNVKMELLRERLPADVNLGDYKSDVYMVDIRADERTRVQFRDDSWCEIDHRAERIRTWGPADGAATRFADEVADAQGWQRDTVTRLEPSARSRGPGRRLDADKAEAKQLADRWRERGYTDVSVARNGVWIAVGAARLHDQGDRVTIHGPATDDAIHALVDKAKSEWSGSMHIFGDDDFKNRAWLAAQRAGVEITNYEPPEHVRQQWESEQARTARAGAAVASVASRAEQARAAKAYASGDRETPPSPEIGAAIDAMTPDARAKLARGEPYEILPQLRALEQRGAALIADQQSAGDRPEALAEHVVKTVAPTVGPVFAP